MNSAADRLRRSNRDEMITRHSDPSTVNPDHDLSHFHRSCALQHRPRRGKNLEPNSGSSSRGEHMNIIDIDRHDGHHLAFSSIDSAKHIDKIQNAGESSAAACIVLELPMTTKSIPTRGPAGYACLALFSDDNRKRRDPVSIKEVQKWRNATGGACYRFKPVFTHQFFTDEKIQGYRPTDGAIEEASRAGTGAVVHSSFLHHGIAGHTLSIQVRLAPSCRKCCLIVEVGKVVEQISTGNDNSSEQYQPDLFESTTNFTHVDHFQGGVVSWEGDDESFDGKSEDFELKENHGGRRKRVRSHQQSHQQTTRQTRRSRRIRGEIIELDNKDDCDEDEIEFIGCRRGRSRRGRLPPKSISTRRTRRMRYDNFGRSEVMHTPRQVARQVTDVSDNPSSDEEVDSYHSDQTMSSIAYNRFCPSPSNNVTRMKVGSIITQLSGGLPEVAAVLLRDASVADESMGYKIMSPSVKSVADVENDYLDQPIGDITREYSWEKPIMRPSVSGGIACSLPMSGHSRRSTTGDFVLTIADMRSDKDACKYHDEVEKLSQWFIEIASPVNVSMNGGIEADGFWRVLYLFEKHSQAGASKYSLAGYMTLFYRDHQMTVCQAVCLPPYQRSGHGTEMLRAAYEACDGREIHVESPAPAFGEELIDGRILTTFRCALSTLACFPVALRNRIDYGLVRSLIEQKRVIPRRFTQPSQLFSSAATPLPDEVLVKVGSSLHITAHQVEIAFDIWKLRELEKSIRSIVNSSGSTKIADQSISTMEANYKRVMIRTLLKSIRANVDEFNFDSLTRREQGKVLERSFNNAIARYRTLIYA
ncbi:hypothetical protein ACHAWU_009532 [Discostella pseudostelligera]|uniref:Histone acetyltransferase n=1 Tax=Discostella pseudostelligera TaxID=259834 RepID=A0ABD3MCR0_9STRA